MSISVSFSFKNIFLKFVIASIIVYLGFYFWLNPYLNNKDSHVLVAIYTQVGSKVVFEAEVADTPEANAKGLMYRQSMPENFGMLFISEEAGPKRFWMKNTYIPLDIIFISPEWKILHIDHNRKPHDETPMGTDLFVKYVLEINAGLADKLGIAIGDRIQVKL